MADLPSTPLVCETVTAATTAGLREARDRSRADLVEVRLDGVSDPDAHAAISGRSRPVVVTCRPSWEGGRFDGDEDHRERLLADALAAGADYVDIEWRAPFRDRLLGMAAGRVVLSWHDFSGMPLDVEELFAAMTTAGAGVVKMAVTARRLGDLLPLLRLARGPARNTRKLLVAMGTAGLPSRLLAGRFGSCWTYAGAGVAPGQIEVARLLDEFRVGRVGPGTSIYAVLGRPVGHSASPALHNAAFAALGIDSTYVPLEAEDFQDFERFASEFGVEGASVTAPFKRDAFVACHGLDAAAGRLGAVNTLRRGPDGDWQGRNTDAAGFLAPLRAHDLRGRRVAVLGAGGAARAVAGALSDRGARVSVFARRIEAAREVARLVDGGSGGLPPPAGSWDVLVNATPVGTTPDVSASPMEGHPLDGALVYDLVYNPSETRLMRDARAAGLGVIGGLDMLVAQAALQFTWWTDRAAPISVMKAAGLARLGSTQSEKAQAFR